MSWGGGREGLGAGRDGDGGVREKFAIVGRRVPVRVRYGVVG